MVYPGQKNIKLQYFRFALVDDKNRFDIAKDPIIIQTERKNSNIRNTMRFWYIKRKEGKILTSSFPQKYEEKFTKHLFI